MSEVRFVFDTNTLVSAALVADSTPRKAFEIAITRGTILLSAAMQDELSEVLRRQKFDKYIAEEKRLRFLVGLLRLATPVRITEQITACRDPKDNKVLELAVSGSADYIITGDSDLLVMNPFRSIAIMLPNDLLKKLAGDNESG